MSYWILHKYEEKAATFNTRENSIPEIIVTTDNLSALYIVFYSVSHSVALFISGTNI